MLMMCMEEAGSNRFLATCFGTCRHAAPQSLVSRVQPFLNHLGGQSHIRGHAREADAQHFDQDVLNVWARLLERAVGTPLFNLPQKHEGCEVAQAIHRLAVSHRFHHPCSVSLAKPRSAIQSDHCVHLQTNQAG